VDRPGRAANFNDCAVRLLFQFVDSECLNLPWRLLTKFYILVVCHTIGIDPVAIQLERVFQCEVCPPRRIRRTTARHFLRTRVVTPGDLGTPTLTLLLVALAARAELLSGAECERPAGELPQRCLNSAISLGV